MKKSTFTTKSATTAYRTEILHNVAANDVASIVADRMKDPKCRDHTILPEGDGKFTLIFIYDA